MASIGKLMLIGNIGRAPEWKQIGEQRVLEFSVAYNRWWTRRDGAQLPAIWFRVTLWPSKKTDAIAKLIKGGMSVHVIGDMDLDEREGKTYYSLRNAEVTPVIGPRSDDASRSTSNTSAARPATPRPPAGDDEF